MAILGKVSTRSRKRFGGKPGRRMT